MALALLLWLPTGISEESVPIVTGHSVFYNGDTFDKCLASIAGIMRSRVMWFNDMVLAERYAGKGTFVYVTEHGGIDPLDPELIFYSDGVFYDFVDPNGAHWHVEELYITWDDSVSVGGVNRSKPASSSVTVGDEAQRQYVWVVELAERPIHDEFAGDPTGPYYHDLYNFLLIVDTCKMSRDRTTPYDLLHEGENLSTERGHPAGVEAHTHEVHSVDLYVGTRPLIVPAGASAQSASWQSEWATGYAAGNATMPSNNNGGG